MHFARKMMLHSANTQRAIRRDNSPN